MSKFNRRDFVLLSSGAAIGNMIVSGLVTAAEDENAQQLDFSHSGLVTGEPKALRNASIPGFLSAEQIAPHHTAHYGGALKGYTSIDAKLEDSFKNGTTIDAFAYDAMQHAKASKGNSVILHELYFDGLASKPVEPSAEIRAAIKERFGTMEKWADDFQASAKSAAGWAMLVLHPVNRKLYNLISDEHAQGPMWMAVPLVVIDTYEHAFYIDYHNRKAEYVEKFMNHIDWAEVNARFRFVS